MQKYSIKLLPNESKNNKMIIHHDQVSFIPEVQSCFNIWKSINISHYIYKLKGNKPHDHFIRYWKSIWQNSASLLVKSFGKIKSSRIIPKHSESSILQTSSQHQAKWRKTWSNLTKIRDLTRLLTLSLYLFNIVLVVLARAIRQQKESKGTQIGKEEVKTSLLANDKIVYLIDPKNSTRELLHLINNFNKVARWFPRQDSSV